jgi:hypothetical protein
MAVEKKLIIYSVYIDFIQSTSSNHWIKINFDSMKFEFKTVVQNFKFFTCVYNNQKML